MALASLVNPALLHAAALKAPANKEKWPGVVNPLHFPPKAKRVIYLFMSGGPSHLELFDPKPRLRALAGEELPKSVRGEQRFSANTSRAR